MECFNVLGIAFDVGLVECIECFDVGIPFSHIGQLDLILDEQSIMHSNNCCLYVRWCQWYDVMMM